MDRLLQRAVADVSESGASRTAYASLSLIMTTFPRIQSVINSEIPTNRSPIEGGNYVIGQDATRRVPDASQLHPISFMGKRKAAVSLSDSDDEEEHYHRVGESESPERPLQTARRSGKKSKVRPIRRPSNPARTHLSHLSITEQTWFGRERGGNTEEREETKENEGCD